MSFSMQQVELPARRLSTWQVRRRDGYLVSTLRRYLSNPKWLFMYVLGRFAPVRWAAVRVAAIRRRHEPHSRAIRARLDGAARPSGLFPGVRADDVVASMRRDGYFAPLELPAEAVNDILTFAEAKSCHPDRDPSVRFAYRNHASVERRIGKPILLARYTNTARDCATIASLERDPLLENVASCYIGAPAVHIGNRLWWSFAHAAGTQTDRVRSGQSFHWDLDDYRTVTYFFYMTDVDAGAGPHTLVRGSHRGKPLRWLCSPFKARDERQVLDRFGVGNLVTLCGPAGTGFAEDLSCLHKGTAPETRDRLILQIRFGLFDYGAANDVVPDAS